MPSLSHQCAALEVEVGGVVLIIDVVVVAMVADVVVVVAVLPVVVVVVLEVDVVQDASIIAATINKPRHNQVNFCFTFCLLV